MVLDEEFVHGNMKEKVSEKVVFKEGRSPTRVVFKQGFLCLVICSVLCVVSEF